MHIIFFNVRPWSMIGYRRFGGMYYLHQHNRREGKVASPQRAHTHKHKLRMPIGRAIAQAVSRWLPTAAARVWSSGICSGQSGAGAGFLRVLRFPLPIFIPPITPQSPSSIICGCTIGQKWPQYLVT
jgi:hypothetical protein